MLYATNTFRPLSSSDCRVCADGRGFHTRPCPGCGHQKAQGGVLPVADVDETGMQNQRHKPRSKWIDGRLVPAECGLGNALPARLLDDRGT